MTRKLKQSALDFSGIGVSILCLAHCLILPVLAVAAPALLPHAIVGFFHDEAVHLLLFIIAAPIAIAGLFWGASISGAHWPTIAAAGVGLALMLVGATHMVSTRVEIIVTVLGVTLLAGAHFFNWRRKAGHWPDDAPEDEDTDDGGEGR